MATQPYHAVGETDSFGDLVLQFDAVPQGAHGSGTVTVPLLAAGGEYDVLLNGMVVGHGQASSPCGPFVVPGGMTLEVEATAGFTPSIQYTAVWWADIVPESPTGQYPLPVPPSTVAVAGEITADQGKPNTAPNAWPVYIPPGDPVTISQPVAVSTEPVAGPDVGVTLSDVTAVRLSSSPHLMTNGIVVKALATNVADVWIGGSGVTVGNGFELEPGAALVFTVVNLNTLYVIGANHTDKVCWSVE